MYLNASPTVSKLSLISSLKVSAPTAKFQVFCKFLNTPFNAGNNSFISPMGIPSKAIVSAIKFPRSGSSVLSCLKLF